LKISTFKSTTNTDKIKTINFNDQELERNGRDGISETSNGNGSDVEINVNPVKHFEKDQRYRCCNYTKRQLSF